ncbi:14155_t:CDS:2, partial [Cetraspora pellucida]
KSAECNTKDIKFKDTDWTLDGEKAILDANKVDKSVVVEIIRISDFIRNPIFFINDDFPGELKQGGLGDCWFLAALAAIEDFPRVIKSIAVARDEINGIYGFVFFIKNNWVGTIVDDYVFVKQNGHYYFSECTCRRETWASLLEKAYAKVYGGYEKLKGGHVGEAFENLSGQTRVVYNCSDILTSQTKKDALWESLLGRMNHHIGFGCETYPKPSNGVNKGPDGLILGHVYSVIRAVRFKPSNALNVQLVEVRNPWAHAEFTLSWNDKDTISWKPGYATKLQHSLDDDGSFFMTYDDFLTHFKRIESCAFQFAGECYEVFSDPLDFPDRKQTITHDKLPPVVYIYHSFTG